MIGDEKPYRRTSDSSLLPSPAAVCTAQNKMSSLNAAQMFTLEMMPSTSQHHALPSQTLCVNHGISTFCKPSGSGVLNDSERP